MAINKVMIVVKLYNITILLCLASFVDSHKLWDTIIQTSIPKIAMMEIQIIAIQKNQDPYSTWLKKSIRMHLS